MEDTGTPGTAPAETPAGPAVETPPAAQPDAGVETDPFDDDKVETFDRKYVEKLRREAADHRTRAKEAEAAFEGWTPEDRQVWQETIKLAASRDPEVSGLAAQRLREIADLLSKGATPEQAIEATDGKPAEEQPKYLTKEELDRQLEEREQQRQVETKLQEIQSTARELGYEPSPEDEDYQNLLWVARNKTGFDLQKAHEHIQAKRQAVVDAYLEEKRKQADGSLPAAGGAHVSGENKHDGSFQTARERLEARLRAMKPVD